ncbi:MAG: sensor histidine kinase [Spirochaetaceae bacterium]|nr:MAG: sensor histidine kinase [Spirochaetaceae bacterium]
MNSMFRLVLAAFLVTVLVILGVLALGLFSGYSRSLTAWSRERQVSVERSARQILSSPGQEAPLLPLDVPLFIYDRDRQLVASNRGVGRRREVEGMPLLPVRDSDDTLLGYYSVGAAQFQADAANQALLRALLRGAVAALLAATAIALVSGPLLARYLSRPAAQVASGIDRMAEGNLDIALPEVGVREISGIARSANLLAERLRREQSIRTQWVQDVAHDLRSPVAMIKAQLEAMADGVYQADATRLKRLMEELGRVETLINDLDELMRLEAPELKPEISTFSAAGFLAGLRERFADILAETGWTLEERCAVDHITGDENLLYRALSNLLSNAIHHGGSGQGGSGNGVGGQGGGRVRCTLTRGGTPEGAEDGPLRISVWNDGPPVPPEDLPRVFDRLYRGEYARNTPGSGLGLTIARRIVQLHGGTIAMDSAAGAGTTLTIEIPLNPG